jgi:hypothetical protein
VNDILAMGGVYNLPTKEKATSCWILYRNSNTQNKVIGHNQTVRTTTTQTRLVRREVGGTIRMFKLD